jgi:hypothetical protein
VNNPSVGGRLDNEPTRDLVPSSPDPCGCTTGVSPLDRCPLHLVGRTILIITIMKSQLVDFLFPKVTQKNNENTTKWLEFKNKIFIHKKRQIVRQQITNFPNK